VDNLADADSLTNAEKEEEQIEMEEAEEDYDDEKYDENGNGESRIRTDGDDEEEEGRVEVVGARPRRISHLASQKSQKPIPKASSLFILSHTNVFRVFCNKIVSR